MNYQINTVYGRHIILEIMSDNPIIVDAGACTGGFIKRWGQHREKMEYKIIAIECDRDHVKTIKSRNLRNIVICNKALVGHKPKQKPTYYKYLGRPTSGSVGYIKQYIINKKDFTGMKQYKVNTLPVNKIFSEFKIRKIDYLKMNIEGSERNVLRAMTHKTASKIKQISVSIHTNVLSGISQESIISRLHELGFVAWAIRRKEIYGFREEE